VYVPQESSLTVGSALAVTLRDGSRQVLPVVGRYAIKDASNALLPPSGLLMAVKDFTKITQPDSISYFVQVAPGQAEKAGQHLRSALPGATVVDMAAYAARYMHSYEKLYVVPVALAGLAMLAGLLLVANAASLAMLERRYEIGILKTVGYSRRQVLTILAAEYGLVSLLATGTGVLCIEGLLGVLALAVGQPAVILLMPLPALAAVALGGIGLTLAAVLWVSWEPTRVSPVLVLNERY
jgi:putative ABC transport system permease protein